MLPERTEIANGVGFVHVAVDKFKSNRIDVRFVVPLRRESAALNALVPEVLSCATKNHPSLRDMSVAAEEMYGADIIADSGKFGDAQVVIVGASFLSDKYSFDGTDILGRVLGLLKEMIFEPKAENGAFSPDYVEIEKKTLIDYELSRVNNKRRYAQERLIEEMFEGDPYGISENGTVEQIAAVTPESLYGAYEKLLKEARVEICAVGDMDGERVKNFFAEAFGKIGREPISPVVTVQKKRARENVKYVREHQSVTQGKLSLGFSVGDVDMVEKGHILDVAVGVFGGSATSKLFMNVREKLSLCYYCSAGFNDIKGFMAVSSGILFENEKKAFDEITAQLRAVQNGDITDDELDSAKKGIINKLNTVFDNEGAISGFVFGKTMLGVGETIEEKKAKISSVTKEQISEIAKGFCLDTYYFLCGEEDEK